MFQTIKEINTGLFEISLSMNTEDGTYVLAHHSFGRTRIIKDIKSLSDALAMFEYQYTALQGN